MSWNPKCFFWYGILSKAQTAQDHCRQGGVETTPLKLRITNLLQSKSKQHFVKTFLPAIDFSQPQTILSLTSSFLPGIQKAQKEAVYRLHKTVQ